MKFGSLFSGIGGLDLGLERAGMECRWQVEYSEYPQAILRQHWPDIPVYTDIHDVDFSKVEPVDLICGGFPCQPFSTGGKRRGMRDPRWLWNEFARAIDTIKPSYVLGENVPGLLSADQGAAFGYILADLASLGYDAQWEVVPAAAVGAPHHRERLFIVAYRHLPSNNCSCRIFTRPGSLGGSHQLDRLSDWAGIQVDRQDRAAIVASYAKAGASSVLCRVDDGPAHILDRIKACGNAVVPAVAEYVGRCILNTETQS